jgi:hypothetical protein
MEYLFRGLVSRKIIINSSRIPTFAPTYVGKDDVVTYIEKKYGFVLQHFWWPKCSILERGFIGDI